MKAGALNRRITIQSRSTTQDAAGQPVQTWTDVVSVWANVAGATGMASIRQSQARDGIAVEMNSYSFRIRYRTSVNAGMRVVYGGLNYDIKQVRHDLDNQDWTDLVCEVGGNDG